MLYLKHLYIYFVFKNRTLNILEIQISWLSINSLIREKKYMNIIEIPYVFQFEGNYFKNSIN